MAFREEGRAWFSANVPKDWVQRRNAEESMEARFAYLRSWQRKLFDAGWAGISWPKEYGGGGGGVIEHGVFTQERGRAGAPPPAHELGVGPSGATLTAVGADVHKRH